MEVDGSDEFSLSKRMILSSKYHRNSQFFPLNTIKLMEFPASYVSLPENIFKPFNQSSKTSRVGKMLDLNESHLALDQAVFLQRFGSSIGMENGVSLLIHVKLQRPHTTKNPKR